MQLQHFIPENNVPKRLEFANKLISLKDENFDLGSIWFSDEAHFYLSGYVNKQNFRYWGTENPHVAIVKPLTDTDMLENVIEGFENRLMHVIASSGTAFEHLIY